MMRCPERAVSTGANPEPDIQEARDLCKNIRDT
jgi:hypothetical protein